MPAFGTPTLRRPLVAKLFGLAAAVFVASAFSESSAYKDPSPLPDPLSRVYPVNWYPSASEIAHVELLLKLPPDAHPLATYERYYSGTWKGGHLTIVGVLIFDGPSPGKIKIVDADWLPYMSDGNMCSSVEVDFDVATDRITRVYCPGPA